MSIFKHLSYLDFLHFQLKQNRKSYGYKSRVAEAAQCQPSYLSHVLKGKAHFTFEQAQRLASFWNLARSEQEYFLDLVMLARAGSPGLKDLLAKKLERSRLEQENLAKRIEAEKVLPDEHAAVYYSGWEYTAVHMLLTVPEFREPPAISQRLGIQEPMIRKILSQLQRMGLAKEKDGQWSATGNTIHVARDSRFNILNHSHWRQRGLNDALGPADNSIHFTSVHTISRKDVEKIRALVFHLIDESRKIVAPTKEEDLYCLTCDWFRA